MFGKPAWFQRRKYTGWGIAPKTWQGWVYVIVAVLPLVIFQSLPYWSVEVRYWVTIGWVALLVLDVFHIMTHLDRDEREYKIEAISERNSAWTMILIIGIGVAYQAFKSASVQGMEVDSFLIAALIGGVIAKAVSNLYYSKKPL